MSHSVVGTSQTMTMVGLDSVPVTIEASITEGLPHFAIVGLPDTAVNEAKERIRASFHTVGLPWPNSRVTVNLSPAHVTKHGTAFDLGIAVAILGALRYRGITSRTLVLGELGLDGSIRKVRGVLPAVIAASARGFGTAIIPAANCVEAQLASGVNIFPVDHLAQVASIAGIHDIEIPDFPQLQSPLQPRNEDVDDLSDVRGQDDALWAMTVAAAGGHHFQMIGPPGVGKSMIAQRMVGVLPDLLPEQALDVAIIRSAYGEDLSRLPQRPPFISPHHSATTAAIVGGGAGIPKPGAVTMAHHGVLYFDEFPEFSTNVIQALRQPLENGIVEIDRSKARVRFPARFQFVSAANPCRCGKLLDGGGSCTCSSSVIHNYRSRLGGPVRDRIDVRVVMRRPHRAHFSEPGVSTSHIQQQVADARERQKERCRHNDLQHTLVNAHLPQRWLSEHSPKGNKSEKMIDRWLEMGEMSMRGVARCMRISWTLADLFERAEPGVDELVMARDLLTGGDIGARF